MFIGAMGFNISNIAAVLVGDVPLDLSTSQEVGALLLRMRCVGAEAEEGGWGEGIRARTIMLAGLHCISG